MFHLCILCDRSLEACPSTEEHVVPFALGGALAISWMCKDCNDRLGQRADAPLTDHPLIRALRAGLGIRNRNGEVPSIAMRVREEPALEVLYTPGGDHGPAQAHIPTRVFTSKQPHERERTVIFPSERAKAEEIVAKWEARRGIHTTNLEPIERTYSGKDFECKTSREHTTVFAGLAKIAYELAHYWLGPSYLDDPIRLSLQSWLRACLNDPVSAAKAPNELLAVSMLDPSFTFPDFMENRVEHVAWLARSEAGARCVIRVFNVFIGSVLITRHAPRYPEPLTSTIVFDPVKRTVHECPTDKMESYFLDTEPARFRIRVSWQGESRALALTDGDKTILTASAREYRLDGEDGSEGA